MKNLYDILQVSENASDEIIEKAYKTLVKKYHPDLQPKEKKQVAEAMMKSLNEAYEVLSDPVKKEKYDRERAELQRQKEAQKEAQRQQQQQAYYARETTIPRQETVRQNPIEYQEPRQTYSEKESFLGYMGNLVTGAFSKRNRERRKIENAYREGYQEAYANYWRAQGFKVKEPWTLKRVKELIKSILIFTVVLLAIWFFPPTHNFLVETYESNEMLKGLVDGVIQFFKRFFANLFS